MGHYLDSKANKKAFQSALNASLGARLEPQLEVDGDLGENTAAAVRLWRQINNKPTGMVDGKPVYAASVDAEMLRLLGLGPALMTEPGTLANIIVLPLIDFALNQALKGTGITMDFAKFSKAIAGAISGAGLAAGTSAYTYISLPPEASATLPHWVGVAVPLVNMAIGALIGFAVVYWAPANKTTS